jgi:hypothetical protein
MNAIALWSLTADLSGPGIVDSLEYRARHEQVHDWLDHVNPPREEGAWDIGSVFADKLQGVSDEELSTILKGQERRNQLLRDRLAEIERRWERGRLTDPLSPLFEVVAHSMESRRYEVVSRAMASIQNVIRTWLEHGADPKRTTDLLFAHLGDLLEIAVHSGSFSQIHAMIRMSEILSIDAVSRHEKVAPLIASAELVRWSRRLQPLPPSLRVSIIDSITRIAEAAIDNDELETFDQCALDLGRIAEILGQIYRRQIGIHVLERNVIRGQDERPEDALVNSMYHLVRAYTQAETKLGAYPHLQFTSVFSHFLKSPSSMSGLQRSPGSYLMICSRLL